MLSVLGLVSCKNDGEEPVLSSEKEILSFVFSSESNLGLVDNISGQINDQDSSILLQVPFDTSIETLVPSITYSENAAISPRSNEPRDFTQPILYTVTAEDTTERTYSVTVEVLPNSQSELLSFVFEALNNEELSEDVIGQINEQDSNILLQVPFDTSIEMLVPSIIFSENATISPRSNESQDFTQPILYTVTAEDTTERAYSVTVEILPNNESELLSFVFEAFNNEELSEDIVGEIDQENRRVNLTLPFGVSRASLIPSITVSAEATISPNSGQVQDFSEEIAYLVTAEDTTGRTIYIVDVMNTPPASDRQVLELIYNLNPGNTLSWNLDDATMDDWLGVEDRDGDGTIEGLSLNSGEISIIPSEIGYLSNLTSFSIEDDSNISTLPSGIGNLSNLEELSVQNTNLTSIPSEIGGLSNLRFLFLDANSISDLPREIGNLTELEFLYLNNNLLTSIPAEIGNLSSLTFLDLSNNRLSTIPSLVCDLEFGSDPTLIILDDGVICQ